MSSYAKALEGVMRLFPKKVKVSFVDAETGEPIGMVKMTLDQLPEKFNKPMLIEAMGKWWRVLDAEPKKAIEFEFMKNLVLKVKDSFLHDPVKGRWYVPSVAGGMPLVSGDTLFDQFILDLRVDEWRQIEFLPVSLLDQVKEDVAVINSILHPEKKYNRLLGYQQRHVREKIVSHNHNIPFYKLCELVNTIDKGVMRLPDGFVKDGFALRSFNYEYYGEVEEGMIKSLCVKEFDCVDEEILNVLSAFGLLLVVWCEGKIISGEMKEGDGGSIDLPNSGEVSDAMLT